MKVKMPAREDAEIDMAPMIDMVFLLLVFFMVASIAAENRYPIETLPHSGHAKVPSEIKGRMILSQDAEGNVFDDMEPIELEDLPKRIKARMADPVNPVKKVLIRADERVRYKDSKKIMVAGGEAGMVDLIYTAFEK